MMLFWKIRYLDRSDRQFKDRCLYLHTKTLNPITRAAVELLARDESVKNERGILKFRHFFTEEKPETEIGDARECGEFRCVGSHEYMENEACEEITPDEMAQILTGSPTARVIPSGAKQHDLDFMFSEPKPIPLAEVSLSPEEIKQLGYFARDLRELMDSAFLRDKPGTLGMSGSMAISPSSKPTLKTPSTDDEIRSFVTIFRRLYMANEPANFQKAVATFVATVGDCPHGKWVEGSAKEHQSHLGSILNHPPFVQTGTCTFTTKRLIDVFLYTQYAHQPDEKRQRQFTECLNQVHGHRAVLTWLFLVEMSICSGQIICVGKVISGWFKRYCDHHGISPDVLGSLRDDLSGLGTAEKGKDQKERLFGEQTEKLAMDLWEQAGRPQGGHFQYLASAREQLSQVLQP